eukprot:TRINITY_DN6554_c0_g2_i1.p1 TRINITY_DN6554_c0_g2~~TRINITY_DN6554_c0_g2_i1.p1  ORF type:complete len:240 (+),score=43.23 TRINITY_DN6554_c0_g2_i1:96-722(+)
MSVETDASGSVSALTAAVGEAVGVAAIVLSAQGRRIERDEDVQGLSEGDVLRAEVGLTDMQLERVRDPVRCLDPRSIAEVKAWRNPPRVVLDVFFAVAILSSFHGPYSTPDVPEGEGLRRNQELWRLLRHGMLADTHAFHTTLLDIDVAGIPADRVRTVERMFLRDKNFTPFNLAGVSPSTVASLCQWVHAVHALHRELFADSGTSLV